MLKEKRLYRCTCSGRKELYTLYLVDIKEFHLCPKCRELFNNAQTDIQADGWRALRKAGLYITGLSKVADLYEAKLASLLFKGHPGIVLYTSTASSNAVSFPLWMQDNNYSAVLRTSLNKLPVYFDKVKPEYHLLLSIGFSNADDEKSIVLDTKGFEHLLIEEQFIFGYKVKFRPIETSPYGLWVKTMNPVEKIPLDALKLLIDNASLDHPDILELIAGKPLTIPDDDVLL